MVSKQLTFGANQNKDCVNIMLNEDDLLERTEQFRVTLTFQGNQPVTLESGSAMVEIIDTNSE